MEIVGDDWELKSLKKLGDGYARKENLTRFVSKGKYQTMPLLDKI